MVVDGVLESEGAKICEKTCLLRHLKLLSNNLPGITTSAPRRLGLSFERPANADVVLPATFRQQDQIMLMFYIPPDPALPPLRIATPPTAVNVLPPVGEDDGAAFEMLTFFIWLRT